MEMEILTKHNIHVFVVFIDEKSYGRYREGYRWKSMNKTKN